MARQLPDGTWTSKVGGLEDICHFTLDALESYDRNSGEYGYPIVFLRRRVKVGHLIRALQRLEWKVWSSRK